MINDFGDINFDTRSVSRTGLTDKVMELTDGCMCCSSSLQTQLGNHVSDLLNDLDSMALKTDYFIIETSGITDPVKVIRYAPFNKSI